MIAKPCMTHPFLVISSTLRIALWNKSPFDKEKEKHIVILICTPSITVKVLWFFLIFFWLVLLCVRMLQTDIFSLVYFRMCFLLICKIVLRILALSITCYQTFFLISLILFTVHFETKKVFILMFKKNNK